MAGLDGLSHRRASPTKFQSSQMSSVLSHSPAQQLSPASCLQPSPDALLQGTTLDCKEVISSPPRRGKGVGAASPRLTASAFDSGDGIGVPNAAAPADVFHSPVRPKSGHAAVVKTHQMAGARASAAVDARPVPSLVWVSAEGAAGMSSRTNSAREAAGSNRNHFFGEPLEQRDGRKPFTGQIKTAHVDPHRPPALRQDRRSLDGSISGSGALVSASGEVSARRMAGLQR